MSRKAQAPPDPLEPGQGHHPLVKGTVMPLTGLVDDTYAAYVVFNGPQVANGKVPVHMLKEAPPGELIALHKPCMVRTLQSDTRTHEWVRQLPIFVTDVRQDFSWIRPSWLADHQRVCVACGKEIELS